MNPKENRTVEDICGLESTALRKSAFMSKLSAEVGDLSRFRRAENFFQACCEFGIFSSSDTVEVDIATQHDMGIRAALQGTFPVHLRCEPLQTLIVSHAFFNPHRLSPSVTFSQMRIWGSMA